MSGHDERTGTLLEWLRLHGSTRMHMAADVIEAQAAALAAMQRRVDWFEATDGAWMNAVADVVEQYGYNREAACGPADLLPGLDTLRADAAIGKRLREIGQDTRWSAQGAINEALAAAEQQEARP